VIQLFLSEQETVQDTKYEIQKIYEFFIRSSRDPRKRQTTPRLKTTGLKTWFEDLFLTSD